MGIMLPSGSQGNNQGWRANDLTPNDIAHLLDRFITKFQPGAADECWPWQAGRMPNGYGVLRRSNQPALLAHRVAWVAFTGQALTGQLTIDHLCNVPFCVNPAHLEPVTLAENIRRKNERRGYVIGGAPRRAADGSKTRASLTEAQKQRNRERALAYYYANRERILLAQRGKGRPSDAQRVTCDDCGVELRRDGRRRHNKRMHGAV